MHKKTNKLVILLLAGLIFSTSLIFGSHYQDRSKLLTAQDLVFDEEDATIRAIQRVMPSVVSIRVIDIENVVALDFNNEEQIITEEKREIGNGTGFIISSDGLIITNKHVVDSAKEDTGEYKVILSSGKEYYAQLIGKDPLNDLAVIKIFDKDLPFVSLGNSDDLPIGSSVIAIGNSLGRYPGSASKGIVSGLHRFLRATDETGEASDLGNVIQTDADINLGNSGGPLINLKGEVVGINVAIDESGTGLGFVIPINDAEPVIRTVRTVGRIVRPKLGVRYIMLTPEIAEKNELPRQTGAWLSTGDDTDEEIVLPDSPAAKGGLLVGDIIFEVNAVKVEDNNTLLSILQRFKPGDRIGFKIQRGDDVIIREVELGEFK